jgi:hypothetical protein
MKAFLVIICLLLIAFCQTPQENEEPIQAEGQTLPPPPAEMVNFHRFRIIGRKEDPDLRSMELKLLPEI